jgi:hypothetical protein
MDETVDIVELIEHEMMLLWSDDVSIPKLLKEDSEFVEVIVDGIMLERSFWKRHMVVGES